MHCRNCAQLFSGCAEMESDHTNGYSQLKSSRRGGVTFGSQAQTFSLAWGQVDGWFVGFIYHFKICW